MPDVVIVLSRINIIYIVYEVVEVDAIVPGIIEVDASPAVLARVVVKGIVA